MMDPGVATYGEENRLWTGAEARAFSRVAAVPELLAARVTGRQGDKATGRQGDKATGRQGDEATRR
jgi:hypothetical protein